MNIFKVTALAFVMTFGFVANTIAEENVYYKWTDEEGIIHYTQRAPKGIEAELITTKVSDSSSSSNSSGNRNNKEDDKPKVTRSEGEQVIQKDADLCKRAQANAQILKTKPIVRQNNKVLSLDEKNSELQKLNQIISDHC